MNRARLTHCYIPYRMRQRRLARAAWAAGILAFALGRGAARGAAVPAPVGARFEPNVGQADPRVRFVSRAKGHALFLTDREAVLVLRKSGGGASETIRMTLPGARFAAGPEAGEILRGRTNYFLGRDPRKWRSGVAAYGSVRYAGVYPGIDLVYHGRQGSLEYDFDIARGADAGRIALAFEGLKDLGLDGEGNLVLATVAGRLVQRRPVAWQERDGVRTPVSVAYALEGRSRARFVLGPHDPALPLTIDPVLSYSSYLGGALADSGLAVAADAAGNSYLAGQTDSLDFPVTPGAAQPANAGGTDVFLAKVGPGGAPLVFATYLGGSSADNGNGVALGPGGTIFVAGETASLDFPTTAGAFQTANPGRRAGFVAKLDASGGTLVFSTYLGGTATARCNAIAVDSAGQAYVVGRTDSADFPTTAGSVFPIYRGGQFDAYVSKLNASGSGLVYSTFMGGGGNDALFGIALGPGNTACVTGGSDSPDYPTTASAYQTVVLDTDPVITKLDGNGASLMYSTFFGGSSDMERSNAIAVDPAGFLCVAGFTPSSDFPTKNAAQPVKLGGNDAWTARFNPNASGDASLVYSTFLGGAGSDRANGVAVDAAGNAWVAGQTGDATGFPLVDPIQAAYGGGASDAFVTKVSPAGAFVFSTLLGGSGSDQANAVAAFGADALVTGTTDSADFPTVAPLQAANRGGSDAFFARIRGAVAVSAVPALSPALLAALAAGLALAGALLLRRE
jgi:hypothetical protein